MHRNFYKYLSMVIFYGIFMQLAWSKNLPIQIRASSGSVDMHNMTSSFSGNLIITQGSLVVHANSGQASQDKYGNKKLVLLGNSNSPVTFQERTLDKQLIKGHADKFEYNSGTSIASLSGNAQIAKGKSLIKGDKLTYNTQTEFYTAITNDKMVSSGQVTIILDSNDANKSHK